MATKPLTVEQCREALDILARCGNMTLAASSMGMSRTTFYHRVTEARRRMDGQVRRTELCLVHSEDAGIVEFRGEEFVV